jgi:uncharacterized membrane protein
MKHLFTAAAAAALTFGVVGCGNKGTEGGQPGTNNSFTVSAPSGTASSMTAPTIKQDTDRTIELTVKANKEFDGKKVTLKAEAPKGLHASVKPESVDLAASQEQKIQLVVHAEKDAPAGEFTIKVTGTSDKGGTPSTDNVKVKVEANNASGSGSDNKNTVTIDLPTTVALTHKVIKKEATETIELTIKTGSGFTGHKVAVKAEHDPKIKVEVKPESVEVGANGNVKVQMVVSPGKDAPAGEQTIRVTATPDAGTAAVRDVKVKVE